MPFSKLNYREEEFWNTVTHGFGTVLSLGGLVLLTVYSGIYGGLREIITAIVFGVSLVLLYSASTIYHATTNSEKKEIFQKFDHLCIYILIAGTYTPVMLVGLGGVWGWTLFGSIWGMVVFGFWFKFSPFQSSQKISLILYAVMGWLAVIAIKPLLETLSTEALLYLGLGGISYTMGIFFFANERIPYNHAIWHGFVLAGSIFHFFAIFSYILP